MLTEQENQLVQNWRRFLFVSLLALQLCRYRYLEPEAIEAARRYNSSTPLTSS
jgi:hypothetical protein